LRAGRAEAARTAPAGVGTGHLLLLAEPPPVWLPWQRAAHGVEALAVDEESALHVLLLPLIHRDPFDRLLVAQAIVHGMIILTPDPIVARYPARTMW
jgi:PIN domain nuclease of toxin-antitoxin system